MPAKGQPEGLEASQRGQPADLGGQLESVDCGDWPGDGERGDGETEKWRNIKT